MKSVSQLRAWRENLRSMVAKTAPIRDKFLADKAKIESDGSRHKDWIREKVGEARDAAYPLVGKHLAEARNLASVVAAEAAPWRSIPFVLSKAVFNKDDPLSENSTRANWHRELMQMPAGLFALVAEDMKRDGNFAGLYQCYLVGMARRDEKHFHQVDISKLEIPEQREALDLITECSTMPVQIESVVNQLSGRIDQNALVNARRLQPLPMSPIAGFDEPSELPKPQDMADPNVDPSLSPLQRLQKHRDQQAGAA